MMDLVIEVDDEPGALARVAAAISDAGVNISAATWTGPSSRAEMHILVPHAEAARHACRISSLAVTREREVVVVEVDDRPGVLADLARKVADAGINIDLVYVATHSVWCSAPTTSRAARPPRRPEPPVREFRAPRGRRNLTRSPGLAPAGRGRPRALG